MLIIHENGRCEEVAWKSYRSIVEGVNKPGCDDSFTSVPIPERDEAGYTVYANDVGLLIGLDPNPWAEVLCRYSPLVGPIVVLSFEESHEDDLIGSINPGVRAQFEKMLSTVKASAMSFYAKQFN